MRWRPSGPLDGKILTMFMGGESGGKKRNRLRWLGNGWSHAQSQIGGAHLAQYLQPEFTDAPASPSPEKSPSYLKRPFSY
jgi:hypothetical protein